MFERSWLFSLSVPFWVAAEAITLKPSVSGVKLYSPLNSIPHISAPLTLSVVVTLSSTPSTVAVPFETLPSIKSSYVLKKAVNP